nr:unnamed protein product [Digitaria exilis]
MGSRQHNAQFHKSKTLDNKYMLGDEIGKGAYGRVYKGLDLENGDFVAIKQVSLENIPQEDLNIIMNLNHKNIVKYLGSLKTKSHLHIILEYVENGSLANIIKPNKFGPFPESLVAVYIAQVLEGLVYLHEQGVIHRDIKGANILTTKEGLVKLADFGVATKLTEADINTHSVVGTPYWMAPEVIEMSGVCAASDIWSVGCTVIELLTCAPPYYDLQPMPALFRIVQDVHPPIPEGLSPEITDFLRQCFQKDAMQRPDAKTLLMHRWLQNSRRVLPASLRQPTPLRNIDGDDEGSSGHNSAGFCGTPVNTTPVASDVEQDNGRKELVLESSAQNKPDKLHDGNSKPTEGSGLDDLALMKDNIVLDKDPTLVLHDKLPVESSSGDADLNEKVMGHELQVSLPSKIEPKSKESSCLEDGDVFSFQAGRQNIDYQKVAEPSFVEAPKELSRFSDKPGDASLDDLFPPIDKQDVNGAQASTSTNGHDLPYNGVSNDFAKALNAAVVEKQKGNDNESMNGGKLIELADRLQDIDARGFGDNIAGEGLFPWQILSSVLQLINNIVKDNTSFLENACLVGLIPVVMNFAEPNRPKDVRVQASLFLQQLCQARDMVHLAIDGIWQVFKLQHSTLRNDFCRIAAKNGVLLRLVNTLHSLNEATRFASISGSEVSRHGRENGHIDSIVKDSNRVQSIKYAHSTGVSNEGASTSGAASQTASGVLSGSGVLNLRPPGSTTSSGPLAQMFSSMSADVAREYLEKVADLLLEFAQADTVVKSLMASQSLLARIFQMFNKIEPPILLKILRCINHLSGDPNCLETLQRTDAIKHLIPILELRDGPLVYQIHSEVLNALFNLCKINKRRQEQAAENGIIPHLMNFVMSDSPLRQYALPLLCDMAHASRNSREQLRAHGGLDVYLNLLEDDAWACTALDSIAVCLAHDNDHRKVEQALLKKEAIQKLVKFFQDCPEQYFVHTLDAFLKIITKSSRINTAMATNGLTTLLIARLDHREAIARLTLLKLIKVVYEHHPRPKQLIVENDLPQKLQNLIEERRDGQRGGQQVLVKQMATSLLKALHINTVL